MLINIKANENTICITCYSCNCVEEHFTDKYQRKIEIQFEIPVTVVKCRRTYCWWISKQNKNSICNTCYGCWSVEEIIEH